MKKLCILIAAIAAPLMVFGQYFTSGLLMNDDAYDSIPQKVELLTRDYTGLPSSASLKQYAPIPRNQGQYGTCTSWSTTYCARTICEAYNNGWTDKQKITDEAFAPIFIYSQIEHSGSCNCSNGTYIHEAFQVLKQKGAPKLRDYNYMCACQIPQSVFNLASAYKISNYFTLFSSESTAAEKKISTIKKALAEHCPVVISFACWNSFQNSSACWNGQRDYLNGHHAMCVVGYDDNMYGGAFEIQNSWGTDWANNGYVWMRYADFAANISYAIEMFVAAPEPTKEVTMSGQVSLKLSNGNVLSGTRQNGSLLHYKIDGNFISGTRYRVYVSNQQPAYVYIIGSDDASREVDKLFPMSRKYSAALTYSSNNIAFPSEQHYIEMDEGTGANYLCVLFCSEEQDIDDLVFRISGQSGTFAERVRKGLGNKMVPLSDVKVKDGINFSSTSESEIIPIILEMNQR